MLNENQRLLLNKEIYSILDGDKNFGTYTLSSMKSIDLKMPYLSGPELCELSTRFGLPVTYSWKGGGLSRWQYLENLMSYTIQHDSFSNLLTYLFSIKQFEKTLVDLSKSDILEAHKAIINRALEGINSVLIFADYELMLRNGQYYVIKIGEKLEVDIPTIRIIDRLYIKNMSERATKDVEDGNFDSAVTHARTLLEEVFMYVIERKDIEPSQDGDISKLYKQVRDLYNMHTDKNMDRRINTLLSGLNNIVNSIAELRNKESDSHGAGQRRVGIDDYHARLAVNASVAMAEFILSVSNKQCKELD